MSKTRIVDMSRVPFIPGRIHATNNRFQRYGPKGFMEIQILQNDNLYVLVDLPGVPDDAVPHRVDAVRQKVVFFSGETPSDKKDVREYAGTAGLGCDCCEDERWSLEDDCVKGQSQRPSQQVYSHSPSQHSMDEPSLNMKKAEEPHPFVVKGRKHSNASEGTDDGSFIFSVDLPGVCSDDILVLPNENEVKFYGENKEVYEHDQSCRIFMGAINHSRFSAPGVPLLSHSIAWDAEFGVLKVRISPPSTNINSE